MRTASRRPPDCRTHRSTGPSAWPGACPTARAERPTARASGPAARSTGAATCPGLLSIVVPCYQVEDFLDECLVSLRFQHYREVEIIVVDDGSPDRSGEIARRHARRDLRVRVVTRENGGLSAARNTGIEHARGEFLTFVDSDDVVTPRRLHQRDRRAARVRLRLRGQLLRPAREQEAGPGRELDPSRPRPPAAGRRPRHVPRRDGQRRRLEQDLPPGVLGPGRPAVPRGQALRGPAGQRGRLRPGPRLRRHPRHLACSWRIRNDRSSISQSSWSTRNLAAHNDAVAASFEALRSGRQGARHPRSARSS